MKFTHKTIPTHRVLLIDIGSYKIKIALCEYKNSQVHFLAYAEKKQEIFHIKNGAIKNISGVFSTLVKTMEKIEPFLRDPYEISINLPTPTLIASTKDFFRVRQYPEKPIDLHEVRELIEITQQEALTESAHQIYEQTGYLDIHTKVVTSSLTDLKIDEKSIKNPLGKTGKRISLRVLNLFIPTSVYAQVGYFEQMLWHSILSFVPMEYCLPKLLNGRRWISGDIVFLDVGNAKTSVVVQKAGHIIGMSTFPIGIEDLTKSIQKDGTQSRVNIIAQLNHPESFLQQKKHFFQVWEVGFLLALKDILPSNLVPYQFVMTGWWEWFFHEYIKKIDLRAHMLHSLKPFEFLEIDLKNDLPQVIGDENIFADAQKSMIALGLATGDILSATANPLMLMVRHFFDMQKV